MTSNEAVAQRPGKKKMLPLLVLFQLLIAALTVVITVTVGLKIKPLIETKIQLEKDIVGHKEEVTILEDRLAKTREELETTSDQLSKRRKELETTSKQLKTVSKELEESRMLVHETLRIDFVDLKVIYSLYPRQAELLEVILDLRKRGVGWGLHGTTPSEGFNSPVFAAYVLRQVSIGFNELVESSSPEVGDLVVYPAGYHLFYFKDKDNRPFVIGMTPLGIVALNPDFAKPIRFLRASY